MGETKEQLYEFAGQVAALLPTSKPRYLMGVGSPEDLVEGVARGIDMFDCALPTRVARNGALFTPEGRVDVTKSRYAGIDASLDEACDCYTCRNYSAANLHHLFRAKELLGLRLASIHNLRFVLRLMQEIRRAVAEGPVRVLPQRVFGPVPPHQRQGPRRAETPLDQEPRECS